MQNLRPEQKMPLLSNLTAVVLLLIAHCGSWAGGSRWGPFKVCPSCKDPLGAGRPPRDHDVASSTTVLAQGEPCGVYTLSCAKGLRCVPPPREHSPLQALLQGRGVCAKHIRTSPTERPHPTGKTQVHEITYRLSLTFSVTGILQWILHAFLQTRSFIACM